MARLTLWLSRSQPKITTHSGAIVAKIGFDDPFKLDCHRISVTVETLSCCDANPTFADTVLLDIGFLGAVELDAHTAREQFLVIIRAVRTGAETVGQRHVETLLKTRRPLHHQGRLTNTYRSHAEGSRSHSFELLNAVGKRLKS